MTTLKLEDMKKVSGGTIGIGIGVGVVIGGGKSNCGCGSKKS